MIDSVINIDYNFCDGHPTVLLLSRVEKVDTENFIYIRLMHKVTGCHCNRAKMKEFFNDCAVIATIS